MKRNQNILAVMLLNIAQAENSLSYMVKQPKAPQITGEITLRQEHCSHLISLHSGKWVPMNYDLKGYVINELIL